MELLYIAEKIFSRYIYSTVTFRTIQ